MSKSIVELLEAYPLPEQKEKPPYKIYCDMDGVLTNFESRFEHFTGKSPKQYEKEFGLEQFWHLIDSKIGVRFWVGMDWMPQGKGVVVMFPSYIMHRVTPVSKCQS